MGVRNYLIEGVSGVGKPRWLKNYSDAVTTSSTVTGSCLILAIQRLVNRWMGLPARA